MPIHDCYRNSLPVNFGGFLDFMEMGRDAAVQEYLDSFDKQVAPEFAAAQPVYELLRTKGLTVFVPHNWDGLCARGSEAHFSRLVVLEQFSDPRVKSITPPSTAIILRTVVVLIVLVVYLVYFRFCRCSIIHTA